MSSDISKGRGYRAPYTKPIQLASFQDFVDAGSGRFFKENTEKYWATLHEPVSNYMHHPENKFDNKHHHGTMKRRHLTVNSGSITYIGKESNELEETDLFGTNKETYVKY